MAFTLQLADGSVDGANSYVSVAAIRAYWLDRGIDLSAYTDAQVEAAAIKATDYLDSRYIWVGVQWRVLQGTQWPRANVLLAQRGIPPALVHAACSLAQRVLSGVVLMPDPTFDTSGQKVVETTKKVGPIELTTKFAEHTSGSSAKAVREFPEVSLMLQASGLTRSANSGSVLRG